MAARAGLSPSDRCGPEIPLPWLHEYYGSLMDQGLAGAGTERSGVPENAARPSPASIHIPLAKDERERYAALYRDRPTVFFLTALGPVKETPREGGKPLPQRSQRTWAWFTSLDLARAALFRNDGDLHEDEFVAAVVEEIGAGVMPLVRAEHWFSWDASLQGFVPSEKPEDLAGISHYSIG
jgi:hypothetical protein